MMCTAASARNASCVASVRRLLHRASCDQHVQGGPQSRSTAHKILRQDGSNKSHLKLSCGHCETCFISAGGPTDEAPRTAGSKHAAVIRRRFPQKQMFLITLVFLCHHQWLVSTIHNIAKLAEHKMHQANLLGPILGHIHTLTRSLECHSGVLCANVEVPLLVWCPCPQSYAFFSYLHRGSLRWLEKARP